MGVSGVYRCTVQLRQNGNKMQDISRNIIMGNTMKYYSLAINNIGRHFQTNPYLLQAARDQVSIGGNLQSGCLFYTPIKCDEQALIYLRYQSI